MADIYGPAESFIGEFRRELNSEQIVNSQALTKFVPNPGPMTRSIVEHYIDVSIKRMNVKSIDVLQFHWWDYNNPSYIDALVHLSDIRDKGKIKHVGLTNFDTERLQIIKEQGLEIISNQVQFSILDQRPERLMTSFCQKNNVHLRIYLPVLQTYWFIELRLL